MKSLPLLAKFALLLLALAPAYAGRYPTTGTQTFTYAVGTAVLGDGTTISSNNGVASIQTNPGRRWHGRGWVRDGQWARCCV